MRPRFAKTESSCERFSSQFGGCFNDRSQQVTMLPLTDEDVQVRVRAAEAIWKLDGKHGVKPPSNHARQQGLDLAFTALSCGLTSGVW